MRWGKEIDTHLKNKFDRYMRSYVGMCESIYSIGGNKT